ncbi:ANTAR domain-containing protein [Streptomyces sp. NPDC091279]|uniref:ANTAR domain-containing protein n=1 Tax=unclassified Streptomyces TaxID=2593676 RepID=UPI0038086F10
MVMPSDEAADRIVELEAEVGRLQAAVASHAVVDQAIGMVVALGRVTPEQGWDILREISQHTNIKVRRVAEMILVWGRSRAMPPEIGAELERALERHGPPQIPGSAPER